MSYLLNLKEVKWLNQSADHFDAKTIEGQANLREFIAGMLSYYPAWIKALYGIRWGFVRLLGMKQENLPKAPNLRPEEIPFEAGQWATFFQVHAAQEENFWIASATDKHLSAYIIVAAETLNNQQKRFHVGTIVHYHNWAGPVYFNVIRPFHHIVVSSMMKAGLQPS
jgi:hypothetical protein